MNMRQHLSAYRAPANVLLRCVLLLLASMTALILAFVDTSNGLLLAARLGFTALLAVLALQDLRTKRVSPLVTLPWMAVALARAVVLRDAALLPFWTGIVILWLLNFYGGGDAKLLMGLFGLWPTERLLWTAAIVSLAVGLPFLIAKHRRAPLRSVAGGLVLRLATLDVLPTAEELDRGIPFAFAYCLAGAIYVWTI